jgi:hypothetical protein
MCFKHLLNALLLLSLLALMGCGDLLGNKVNKKELSTSQFQAQCELDVDAFGKILHENIGSQIRCLGENLNLFIRVVESPRPGYMNRTSLEAYLKKNRPEFTPDMIKALKAVYDLNFLITGDDKENISKKNVDQLIDFALTFNTQAALYFGPIFESKLPTTYALHQNHRGHVDDAAKAIVMSLKKIFNPNRNGAIHTMNIVDLLNSFTTEENNDQIEKVKKVLFAKTVLIGGEKEVITHVELERLLLTLDKFTLIALDAARYKYLILEQFELVELLKRDINDFYDVTITGLMGNRDSQKLMKVSEVIDTVKLFVSTGSFNIDDFGDVIDEAKRIFMGGNKADVTGADLKRLLVHGKSLLQTGTVFYRIWDKFKVPLLSPEPVSIDFSDYSHTYPEQEADLNTFERIVKKYRFFKGEAKSAYYTTAYNRNADGIYQVAFFEYLLKEVFKAYGSKSPNASVGGYSLSGPQLLAVIKKFEKALISAKLILPQRATNMADNISLLGTLFQYQSDNNGLLDVNEATEFALTLFTALGMASELQDFYKTKVGLDPACSFDKFDRMPPKCFKNHFFEGICKSYKVYFPLMFSYLGKNASCDDFDLSVGGSSLNSATANGYLTASIGAARTCNVYTDGAKEEIPFSEGDMMTILVVMMHAETTTLRWDNPQFGGNNNNILDANEMDSAYSIYSPALDGFLEGKSPIIKRFKKQIYQYLVKYEQVPDEKQFSSIWKFVRFLISFNKQAPAPRKTLASVLSEIGKQNAILHPPEDPNFCNYLRDPDHIPSEPNTGHTVTALLSTQPASDYSSLLEHIDISGPKEDPIFTTSQKFCFTVLKTQYCL